MMDEAVTLTCNNFVDEGITPEMFFEENIFQLAKVDDNLCK